MSEDLRGLAQYVRKETERLYPEPHKIYPGMLGIKQYMNLVLELVAQVEEPDA